MTYKTFLLSSFSVLLFLACGGPVEGDHEAAAIQGETGQAGPVGATGPTGNSCDVTESEGIFYACNGVTWETVTGTNPPTPEGVDLNLMYRDRIGSVPKVEAYEVNDETGEYTKLWHGSGVIVAQDIVATNYHVCEALDTMLTSDHGYHYEMKVSYPFVGRDGADQRFELAYFTTKFDPSINRDLCLLSVPTGARKYFPMAPFNSLQVMDQVMSIGYPLEFEFVASLGYAEAFTTGVYPWIGADTKIIQISSLIDAGNSGGPTFLVRTGELAGINFGVYMGYNTHAHMLATDYLEEMNLGSVVYRDHMEEILDLDAYSKVRILTTSGYLDQEEDDDYWDEDEIVITLSQGEMYYLQTDFATGTTDPIEGTYFFIFTPDGNWIYDAPMWDGDFMQYLFTAQVSGEYVVYMHTYNWDDSGFYNFWVDRLIEPGSGSGVYEGNLTAQFTSNNSSLHMFVNPSDWVNGYVTPGANVSIVNDLPITINGRIDTDLSYADNQWLDQLWLDDSDSTTITMTITECSMSWRVTRASLLISNGASGYNFIPHIEAYDADNNGIPDQGTCVLTSQSGTVIPPN